MIQPYAIDQRLVLGTGDIQNYLVIRLPGGKETRAPIDLETTKEIVRQASTAPAPMPEKQVAPAPEPEKQAEPVPQEPEDEQPIQWRALPDDVINPLMKVVLGRMNVPDIVSVSVLTGVVQQVNERFTQEDWDEVAGLVAQPAPPAPPAPPPKPAPAPPLGAVTWADGRPVVPSTMNPGRTVQKDEKGYPIPQEGEVDPGEIVGGVDVDEDGVGQL